VQSGGAVIPSSTPAIPTEPSVRLNGRDVTTAGNGEYSNNDRARVLVGGRSRHPDKVLFPPLFGQLISLTTAALKIGNNLPSPRQSDFFGHSRLLPPGPRRRTCSLAERLAWTIDSCAGEFGPLQRASSKPSTTIQLDSSPGRCQHLFVHPIIPTNSFYRTRRCESTMAS